MNETEIFHRVICESDPQRQRELLDELCQSDRRMRGRIESLITAYNEPNSYVDDPINLIMQRDLDLTAEFKDSVVQPGVMIGPYKLLQEIGEGGMGLVFMAEQLEPVKRRVAVKVIKPGMDSRQVIARFEAERQALAMMDHPNIATVLDAGTTAHSYPWFVMELVNGKPITEYCDQEKLTTRERLQLFVSVCRAVQHAHQKGIIHRDLKPNNVLVAEYDGKPVPKVIDFGVAKATGLQLTEKTLFTEFGQVIGTIEYMSPEQARRNQLDVDTRSDIYSLGIVLYKLLTGETPFGIDRFRKAAWEEMVRIIGEEEPPLPSVKIGSSQSLNEIASNRNVGPGQLSALVRGDLDWIVSKTLEKDRNRRYPSAGELADDVERHLEQRPITAGPHTTLDRMAKLAGRHRKSLALAMAGMIALVFLGNQAIKGYHELEKRNDRIVQATQAALFSIERAVDSPVGQEAHWETAAAHCQRIKDAISEGVVSRDVKEDAQNVLDEFQFVKSERELAVQIEDVVINGATNPDLASWQNMEKEMKAFFRTHGFDLDKEDPMVIGKRIRDHRSKVMWTDLLELWIGTRGQMQSLGGPRLNAAIMQPWAEAIYVADNDPIRTGIRKFIYEPPREREKLDSLLEGVDLGSLSARTLSWLGNCYAMIGATDECDHVLQLAVDRYPQDIMLAHDYGYTLFHQKRYQEAARMYHRCLTLRDDVPGLWKSLAQSLSKLNEEDAAQRALEKVHALENR